MWKIYTLKQALHWNTAGQLASCEQCCKIPHTCFETGAKTSGTHSLQRELTMEWNSAQRGGGTPAIQVLRWQKQENQGWSEATQWVWSTQQAPPPATLRPRGRGGECIFWVIYSVTNLQQHCKLAQLHSSYNQEFQELEKLSLSPKIPKFVL